MKLGSVDFGVASVWIGGVDLRLASDRIGDVKLRFASGKIGGVDLRLPSERIGAVNWVLDSGRARGGGAKIEVCFMAEFREGCAGGWLGGAWRRMEESTSCFGYRSASLR
jgi:hypothetical protein